MTRFVFDYWMDGYDTEEEMIEACKEYIYDQLNFTASGVGKISTVDDHIEKLEAQLALMREWLDNNTTHYETEGRRSAIPVLATVSRKIWYHATDDCESYPFTDMMDKAILEKQDGN